MKKFLLAALLFLSMTGTVYGATYYIDFDGGVDTNNGITTGSAFKHCPGDAVATGTAAATTLYPGDTVIFKGGVVYKGKININWSGSDGNTITYDGNSTGQWGTGKGIIDGENIDSDARRYGFLASAHRSYVTIRNFEVRHMGGGITPTSCDASGQTVNWGGGIIFNAGGSHVVVKDCKVWDIGNWLNQPYAHGNYMSGQGVFFKGSSTDVLVENVEIFQNAQYGIGFAPWVGIGNEVTNIEIRNCKLHTTLRWGIYIGLAHATSIVNDIRIHGNSLYNAGTSGGWLGCAGVYPHIDPIMLTTNANGRGSTLGTPEKPVKIYNNSFYYDTESTTGGGTAEIFATAWGGTLYIYNNTFKRILAPGGAILFQGMSSGHPADFHVYNNSFFSGNHGVRVRDLGGVSFTGATALEVNNNAFHHTSTGLAMPIAGVGVPISHFTSIRNNIFWTARSGKQIALHEPGGVLAGLTVDQLNAFGNASGNILADSQFFSDLSYGYGLNTSRNDLRLKPDSPAVNAGLNLSSYFTTDFSGSERPTGTSTWSIGAYQFGGGAAPLGPPMNLRISK